jgi:thymidylate synthase (FAD)
MKAEYIAHSGSDLTVVNAARVSFDKESRWEWTDEPVEWNEYGPVSYEPAVVLASRDAKLVRYLATHNHFTPFTHCTITLRETVPIFVARQRFKHVVGFSYNEVSRRYVDDEPTFYVPEVWRKRADNKKQGSSDEIVGPVKTTAFTVYGEGDTYYEEFLTVCQDFYKSMIDSGVAPEQARMVLPQSMYTSYYVTGSLAAFARAYKLRTTEDAQKEIRDLAVYWDSIISALYPVAWKELTNDH